MAAANSPDAAERPGNGSVFVDGIDEILTARGLESAVATEDWTEKELVTAHHSDERERRKPPKES